MPLLPALTWHAAMDYLGRRDQSGEIVALMDAVQTEADPSESPVDPAVPTLVPSVTGPDDAETLSGAP
jgi:predicted RNase H-like nuclease